MITVQVLESCFLMHVRSVRNNSIADANFLETHDKSVAGFCHQVAAWAQDMFCDF